SYKLQAVAKTHAPLVAVARLDPVLNNGLTQFPEGYDVYFDGSQSTGGAADDPLHYDWNFGDGPTGADGTDAGPKTQHVYSDSRLGGYPVYLTVRDEVGLTAPATINVDVFDVPVTINVNYNGNQSEGAVQSFSSYVHDPNPTETPADYNY